MLVRMPMSVLVRVFLTGRMRMPMRMLMPVVPQLSLVEQKEKHHTQEQGEKQLLRRRARFKRFWQQVHERRCQQGPGCQAQHVLGVARQQAIGQHRRDQHAAQAARQRSQHNGQQIHDEIISD